MKVEQQVPLLWAKCPALNDALEAEKSGHYLPETRGLCLSEEQIVRIILRRPTIGPQNRIIDMITGPYMLARRCEVTAIIILYGLPRYISFMYPMKFGDEKQVYRGNMLHTRENGTSSKFAKG